MPANHSTHDVEEKLNASLEEEYWETLLNEGEYSKSAYIEYDSIEKVEQDNQSVSGTSPQPINSSSNNEDWEHILQIQQSDETITLEITGYNRGGLLVEWRSLHGFVPASQLVHAPASNNYNERKTILANRVGDELNLRVIELDVTKNRLIFSERAAQVESGKRTQILHRLSIGQIIEGHITNLCDFGAFVDLGGIEGLIHISELSWGRVAHPSDMLNSGDTIKVYVLNINEEEERIALSLKRLYEDPWKTVQSRYHIGQIVEGQITNVVDFGAFACIEEGLEGLIHFSELAEGQFLHPRNVVSENDVIQARILSIDSHARRLGLSLRNI